MFIKSRHLWRVLSYSPLLMLIFSKILCKQACEYVNRKESPPYVIVDYNNKY